MKRTDFAMLINDLTGGESWVENISCVLDPGESVYDRAKRIIRDYNAYLQPQESPRRVISTRVLKKSTEFLRHVWEKKSLVSQKGGYDIMQCKHCGSTGKRHGLMGFTIIDREFIKYEHNCPAKIINKI